MKFVQKGVAGVMAIAALSGLAPEARSDSLPGIAGHAYLNQDTSCFVQSGFAAVRNACGSARGYNISLPNRFNATGNRTFKASSTSTATVQSPYCFAVVQSLNDAYIYQSNTVLVALDTTLGTANNVIPGSTFAIACTLQPGPNGLPLASVRVE